MRAKLGVLAVGVVLALACSGSAWAHPGAQAAASSPDWLTEINYWRAAAGVRPVTDQPAWDQGIQDHLTYLEDTPASLRTGDYASAHTENPQSAYYTAAGATEGGDSDLDLGGASSAVQAIDDWLSAPFHAIGMLRAQLTQVAFADDAAGYAGLDVLQGLDRSQTPATTPILFPGPGSTTDLAVTNAGEVPSPLETCGWQGMQVGLPLIALLTEPPDPGLTASLSGPTGQESTAAGSLCLVDEDTYHSSDPVYGPTGAQILQNDHAVLLIPRAPLADGTYWVDIQQPGQDITWSFTAEIPPPVDASPPAIGGWFVEGAQLTEYPGSWTNFLSSFAEQWLRCDATGANCSPIPGATGASYDLTGADVGATIRVQVTASNSGGPSQPAVSAPTSPIYSDTQPVWPSGGSGTGGTGGAGQPHPGAVSRPRILRLTTSTATIRVRLSGSHLVCRLARRVHGRWSRPRSRHCGSSITYRHLAAGRYRLTVVSGRRSVTRTFVVRHRTARRARARRFVGSPAIGTEPPR